MKTGIFKFLQQRSELRLNRKVFVFIVCLIISFCSWLQLNLSKKQMENIPVKVQYVNLPKTRFGTSSISDVMYVEVEADGYDLLQYETKEISVDFKKLKKDRNPELYYFLPNTYLKTISRELGENYKVIKAALDTIQLNPSLR